MDNSESRFLNRHERRVKEAIERQIRKNGVAKVSDFVLQKAESIDKIIKLRQKMVEKKAEQQAQ